MQVEMWRAVAAHDSEHQWCGRWHARREEAEKQAAKWANAERVEHVELERLMGDVTTVPWAPAGANELTDKPTNERTTP